MENNKIKPSLKFLAIPILIFVVGITITVFLSVKSFMTMADMETQQLGTEFMFTAEEDQDFHVFLELRDDQYVDNIEVETNVVTVEIKDTDGDIEVYSFFLNYYGTGMLYYNAYQPVGQTFINDYTLVFTYQFDTSGSCGVTALSNDASNVDFSINQLNILSLFGGIFLGIGIGFVAGIISLVILINIFVKRSKSKKKLLAPSNIQEDNLEQEKPDNQFDY